MINGHGDDIYLYNNVKANFSSNIYPHPCYAELAEHLASRLALVGHYPEPASLRVEPLLAEKLGVSADEVMLTSGATEAIYLIAQAWRTNGSFRVDKPTFSEYADACRMFGYKETTDASVRWLCNPNNPTGKTSSPEEICLEAQKTELLVVDQSYENYTLVPMLTPSDAVCMGNVLQLHSLTKQFSIPGLRLGYVVGDAALVSRLRVVQRPWTVNALAVEAALWLLESNVGPMPHLRDYLCEAQHLRQRLSQIRGISVLSTDTNFMLCHSEELSAAELKQVLVRDYGILIRDASNFEGLNSGHFRIAAQSPAENNLLVAALKHIFQ